MSANPTAPLVGIDLIEPGRFKERLERTPSLRDELFRAGELAYCAAELDEYEHLAARFCAKEAVMKALGMDQWDPLDIEVVGGGEAVALRLHDGARRRANELGVEVAISMSHLAAVATAVAVARPVGGGAGT